MSNKSDWPAHPLLYEINTWPWLRELSDAGGRPLTLADVPDEALERIARLGFDGVWLMGVWERSPGAREVALSIPDLATAYRRVLPDVTADDVVGSPYAIHRYEVDVALGGPNALSALRARLRQLGLRLILDFVPNHLAIDHPWLDEHPNRFVRGRLDRLSAEPLNYFTHEIDGTPHVFAHGRDPNYSGWTDTVQLDYRSRETRSAMREQLAGIARQCDGVRCDMAMLILPEVFTRTWGGEFEPPHQDFWPDAITSVKAAHPGFLFIAEVYWDLEYRLQQLGFDYTYDKRLYDRLVRDDAESLRAHLRASFEFQRRLTRFIENHDEARAALLGPERHRTAAVLALTLPGMRLVHDGQMEGRAIGIPVQLGRRPAESPDPLMESHYERLLHALADPVFHDGEWQLLDLQPFDASGSHDGLIAHQWTTRERGRVVVVNWSASRARGFLPLSLPAAVESSWQMRQLLIAAEPGGHDHHRQEFGVHLDVPPYSYRLLDFHRP